MLVCPMEECVPIPTTRQDYVAMRARIYAAVKSGELMLDNGYEIDDGCAEKAPSVAAKILTDIASTNTTSETNLPLTPEVTTNLRVLLQQYDSRIVENAVQIRNYVTNRLIKESEHPDAKIRIRALELLGKISDVGLFTERSEVTINNKPSSELESLVRERIRKLIDKQNAQDVEAKIIPAVTVTEIKDIKVEDELK